MQSQRQFVTGGEIELDLDFIRAASTDLTMATLGPCSVKEQHLVSLYVQYVERRNDNKPELKVYDWKDNVFLPLKVGHAGIFEKLLLLFEYTIFWELWIFLLLAVWQLPDFSGCQTYCRFALCLFRGVIFTDLEKYSTRLTFSKILQMLLKLLIGAGNFR